jgi:3-carboxy-cis,cis-muconate cycloisomerase
LTTFGPLFVPTPLREAVSDGAWLGAMLEVERALAKVEALAGIVPAEAAAAIGEACVPDRFDIDALSEQGRSPGNPVEPLVRPLREQVGGDAAAGCTSVPRARTSSTPRRCWSRAPLSS